MVNEFNGKIDRVLYYSPKEGYSRLCVRTTEPDVKRNEYNTVTCEGYVPLLKELAPVQVKGEWKGNIFYIHEICPYFLSSNSVVEYIIKRCTGIGKKTASYIVDQLGPNIFHYLESQDKEEILAKKLPELNETKRRELIDKLGYNRVLSQLCSYASKFGITYRQCIKLYNKYGENTLATLKKHPYRTGYEVNFSIQASEAVAKSENHGPFLPERMGGLINAALEHYKQCGHTRITIPMLEEEVDLLTQNNSYHDSIPAILYIQEMLKDGRFCLYKDQEIYYCSLKYIEKIENTAVFHVKRLLNTKEPFPYEKVSIRDAEKQCGVHYDAKQKKAFESLKESGIAIITGGPGTGKTTIMNGIIHEYRRMFPHNGIALCAPTGRAAKRMQESTGLYASTVHKLVEYRPFGSNDYLSKSLDDPIPARLIIVDEVSMLDIELFNLLLCAVESGSLVILIGDKDQLEPVGPGNVLADMIHSGLFRVYSLETIFRQKEGSVIKINGQKIKQGRTDFVYGDDFQVIPFRNKKAAQKKLLELSDILYKKESYMKVQFLCPSYKGTVGINETNLLIQEKLSPCSLRFYYGNHFYTIGDKIIFLYTDYEYGYYNGDTGIITDWNSEEFRVDIGSDELVLPAECAEDMALAYTASVHKSQGSEYDTVVICLPDTPRALLKRKVLYTAVTRAKNKVIVININNAMEKMIQNEGEQRLTGFLSKLKNMRADYIKL